MLKLTKIFGTSGIRGGIVDKVTTNLALDLGRALGTFLEGKGTVGVGTDARTSRDMLSNVFISGIVSTGTNVVDLGGAPMPTMASHSTMPGISSSVVITASHNPPADNGFKFFVGGREYIRSEEIFLENRVADRQFIVADWSKIGKISHWDIRETYIQRVKKFVSERGGKADGVKVLVDTANGAACNYTPHILRDFGFKVTTMNSNPDGHFPGRPAEPAGPGVGVTAPKRAIVLLYALHGPPRAL